MKKKKTVIKKSSIKKQSILAIFAWILIIVAITTVAEYFFISPKFFSQNNQNEMAKNSQTDTINTSNWQTYSDSDFPFSVKYPKSKRSPGEFPVKQYLSQDLSDGYRLTLTDDIFGKGYYFQIIVHRNDLNGAILLNYWKNVQQSSTGSTISCTETTCTETPKNSTVQYVYRIKNLTLDGKNGIRITNTLQGYDANMRLLSPEHIIINMSPNYLMEINKGVSATAEAILKSITF